MEKPMRLTALQALDLGWSVIPVKADKRPYISWQAYQTTKPDKAMITQWHQRYKPPAWAVVTGAVSGILVLDFDGEKGLQTMETLNLEPHVRTGSGGYHVYVEHPGFEIKTLNSKSKRELGLLYPGLDVRADGGYAVFCGKNSSGSYTWLRDPMPYPVSALPEALRRAIGLEPDTLPINDPDGRVPADALLSEALGASVEGRNNAGFQLACRLRDNGYSYDEAYLVMRDYHARAPATNARGTEEPYTLKEVIASLKEAYADTVTVIHNPNTAGQSPGSQRAGDEDHVAVKTRPWPDPLAPEAYHGLAGELVRVLSPHTEADPAALLFSFFVAFGNVIGQSAHFVAEADKHHLNLFAVQVGVTSKGRKGSSLGQILRVFRELDPAWALDRVQSGLSSGEGLIWAVRDPIERDEPIRESKQIVGYQSVVVDSGVEDKRLLVTEGEFASTLRVLGREGNTLSAVMRNAWDTGDLRVLTKTSPAKATGAHISILAHITKDELLRYMESTEAGNGFGNRFLWVCVKRSKVLPEGGQLRDEHLAPVIDKLRRAVEFAQAVGEMRRDETARQLWYEVYPEISEGRPGLLGAVTARAEAQVMRLACTYALLDCSPVIRAEHLKAALAIWRYAEESARFIFGDSLGDPVADDLLKVLKEAPQGLTRTEISNHFGRNKSAREIGRALGVLLERGLARRHQDASTAGKSAERWFADSPPETLAVPPYEIDEINERTAVDGPLSSSNSYISYPDADDDAATEEEWEEGII